MTKEYLLIVMCSLLFINCSDAPKSGDVFVQTDNIISPDSIIRLSPPMRKGELSFDSIVETVKYLPLFTNDTVLISNINDIKSADDILYIADYKRGRIFAFDYDGKYRGKIDALGEGPEQYKRICSFDIDPKKKLLYILDGDLGKVHVYDSSLQLRDVIKLPYKFVDHIALHNGNKLFLEFGFREYSKQDKTSPNLALYNMESKEAESLFFYFENKKVHYRNQASIAFSGNNGKLFYWTTLGSSIYSCNDDFLEKYVDFDLGPYATPSDIYFERNSKAFSRMREKKYAYVDRFYEFKDWYYARISRVTSSAHYFYNKEKQKGFLDISFMRLGNDDKTIMPELFRISDTVFCSYMSPEQYMVLLDDKSLEKVCMEDNQVLVFYKLR